MKIKIFNHMETYMRNFSVLKTSKVMSFCYIWQHTTCETFTNLFKSSLCIFLKNVNTTDKILTFGYIKIKRFTNDILSEAPASLLSVLPIPVLGMSQPSSRRLGCHHWWHVLIVRLTDSGQDMEMEFPQPACPSYLLGHHSSYLNGNYPSGFPYHSQQTARKLLWMLHSPGPSGLLLCCLRLVNYRRTLGSW